MLSRGVGARGKTILITVMYIRSFEQGNSCLYMFCPSQIICGPLTTNHPEADEGPRNHVL